MKRFMTIRRKLIIAFVAVVLPFLLMQVLSYRGRLVSRRQLFLQMQFQASQNVGHEFSHYVIDLRRETHAIGLAIAGHEQQWTPEELRSYLRRLHRDYKSVQFFAWVNPDGKVKQMSPVSRVGVDISDRDYYKRIVAGQTWALSDMLVSRADGEPRFALAYGIRDRGGVLKGIMVAVANPELLDNDLSVVSVVSDSIFVITDSSGRVVFHNQRPNMAWADRDWSKVAPVTAALKGEPSRVVDATLPLTGRRLIGAQTPIGSLGWTAGAFRPMDLALGPAYSDFRWSLFVIAVISSLVLIAIFIIGGSFAKPVIEMANAASEIARGKLSRRVSISSRDEIGVLAERFNFMAESLEQVQKITGQLLTDTPLDELLASLVEGAAALMGTSKAGVFLYDAQVGRIRHVASHGLSKEYLALVSSLPAGVTVCGRASLTHKTTVVDVTSDQRLAPYSQIMQTEGVGTIVCVPLTTGADTLLGALAGYFPPGDAPTEEQVSALNFFAAQAAVALENAQLHRETERRASEMQALWEVEQAVALNLDLNDLATTLAERLSALVHADDCCLSQYDYGTGEIKHIGESAALGTVCPAGRSSQCASLALRTIRSGVPEFGTKAVASNEQSGSESVEFALSVPMILRGQAVGTICLFKQGVRFDRDEIRVVTALAGMAAIAVENAKSYAKERRIAETLQNSLLPKNDFSSENVDIAEVYLPALEEANVGGDFFDVIRLAGGRIGIVIADVAGKGLRAAVHTAMVKYILQAYMFQGSPLAVILAHLNKALYAQLDSDSFVTLFVGIFDPCTGGLTYANAGHEMPVLHVPGRDWADTLDVTGPALGTIQDAVYAERNIILAPGGILALYTDGISEARAGGEMFGMQGIQDVVTLRSGDTARVVADAIVEMASNHAQGRLRDDVAVLVLKFTGLLCPVGVQEFAESWQTLSEP
jgi:serine phosphatase RsbU (regulator of sigma subunit)/HAMP domain-containing protein